MSRTSKLISASPITDELRDWHTRIGVGFVYLQTNRNRPSAFIKGKVRLTGYVVRDYLPALRVMLAEPGRDALQLQLDIVTARLEKGSDYLGAEATRKIDDGYIALLTEYEILSDALQVDQHPHTYLNRFFDRVNHIEKQAPERVGIVGSRGYPDLALVQAYVASLPTTTIVVSGGAHGVDQIAAAAARERGMTVIEYLPDDAHGTGRFHVRNRQIVMDVTRVAAFWDGKSRGTRYTIDYANQQQRSVEVHLPSGVAR